MLASCREKYQKSQEQAGRAHGMFLYKEPVIKEASQGYARVYNANPKEHVKSDNCRWMKKKFKERLVGGHSPRKDPLRAWRSINVHAHHEITGKVLVPGSGAIV